MNTWNNIVKNIKYNKCKYKTRITNNGYFCCYNYTKTGKGVVEELCIEENCPLKDQGLHIIN